MLTLLLQYFTILQYFSVPLYIFAFAFLFNLVSIGFIGCHLHKQHGVPDSVRLWVIRYISSSGLFPDNPIVSAPFRAEPFHGQFSGSSEFPY